MVLLLESLLLQALAESSSLPLLLLMVAKGLSATRLDLVDPDSDVMNYLCNKT